MADSRPTTPAEFLSHDEYEDLEEVSAQEELHVQDWEKTMAMIAQPDTTLTIPRNKDFNRKQVVQAFSSAFELIGGVPRLALWAHANTSDFYKLYARLLPSQASTALGESNELVIKHVLPKGPLDE